MRSMLRSFLILFSCASSHALSSAALSLTFVVSIGCGGATIVDAARSDSGDDQGHDASADAAVHDASSPTNDATSPADAWVAPADAAVDAIIVSADAGDGATKVSACESCLGTKCGADYTTCTASAACMQQLADTALCHGSGQDQMPGGLVLCLGTCNACLCHP